jgi:hypothetical protein
VTVGVGEALFETADSLDLPEVMADDDGYGIAHGNVIVRAHVRAR